MAWIERRNSTGEFGVLIAGHAKAGDPDTLYDFVFGEMTKKQLHEEKRLLYVAATRARNFLYLSGNLRQNKDGSSYAPVRDGFLKLLWPVARPIFESGMVGMAESASAAIAAAGRAGANHTAPLAGRLAAPRSARRRCCLYAFDPCHRIVPKSHV